MKSNAVRRENMFISFLINISSGAWTIIGVVIGFLMLALMILFRWLNKRGTRPSFVSAQGIFDEYGNRILFTIVSNNHAGSRIDKLYISKRFLKIFYLDKTKICYKPNNDFLKPARGEKIPDYLIKGQKSFVTIPHGDLVLKKGFYKLTFSTSDGKCSKIYQHRLNKLFQLSLTRCK